jgi:hypothetical protein
MAHILKTKGDPSCFDVSFLKADSQCHTAVFTATFTSHSVILTHFASVSSCS